MTNTHRRILVTLPPLLVLCPAVTFSASDGSGAELRFSYCKILIISATNLPSRG